MTFSSCCPRTESRRWPTFVGTQALGGGPISLEGLLGWCSRVVGLFTRGCPSWEVDGHRALIHRTRHGAAQPFGATPTTWQLRRLPRGWSDSSTWSPAFERWFCVPSRFGGAVTVV